MSYAILGDFPQRQEPNDYEIISTSIEIVKWVFHSRVCLKFENMTWAYLKTHCKKAFKKSSFFYYFWEFFWFMIRYIIYVQGKQRGQPAVHGSIGLSFLFGHCSLLEQVCDSRAKTDSAISTKQLSVLFICHLLLFFRCFRHWQWPSSWPVGPCFF